MSLVFSRGQIVAQSANILTAPSEPHSGQCRGPWENIASAPGTPSLRHTDIPRLWGQGLAREGLSAAQGKSREGFLEEGALELGF